MESSATVDLLINSCLTITIRAASLGSELSSLTLRSRRDEAVVQQVIVHLSAIRIATRALSELLERDADCIEKIEDVKNDIFLVLNACSNIFVNLEAHSTKGIGKVKRTSLGGRKVIQSNNGLIKQSEKALCKQETALLLILSALNRIQPAERHANPRVEKNQTTPNEANSRTSPVFSLRDDRSFSSNDTLIGQNVDGLQRTFSFDPELSTSPVYQPKTTVLTRKDIHGQKPFSSPLSNSTYTISAEMVESARPFAPVTKSEKIVAPIQCMTLPPPVQLGLAYAVVLYDFQAEYLYELQATAGESLYVLSQTDQDWVVARPISRLGSPGLIPISFIEIRDKKTNLPLNDKYGALKMAGVPQTEDWKRWNRTLYPNI